MATLSEWALRERAAEEGFPVSGEQFHKYRTWGLLPEPDADGRWSEDWIARLIRIRELGGSVRQVPRRVILLRCEGFPVPAENLRDAMCAVARTIPTPARSMKQVLRVRRRSGEPAAPAPSQRQARAAWRPPPPGQWVDILRRASREDIEARAGFWCYFTAALRSPPFGDDPIREIPLEEVVTIFAIQDIAARSIENQDLTKI